MTRLMILTSALGLMAAATFARSGSAHVGAEILDAANTEDSTANNSEASDAVVQGSPVTAGTPVAEIAAKKSIVPAKYGDKYKNGGSDALADFIKTQCSGKDGFEYTAFFELCRKNGIAEEQVAKYEGQVAEKAHGSQGRARMTLRNMLATIARKNGGLHGLDGNTVSIELPKPALSGAAAANAESASTETEGAAPPAETTGSEDAENA